MAIIHVAYTFDPGHFLKIFQEKVFIKGQIQYEHLQAWARRVAGRPSSERQSILEMIRFDPGALSTAESEAIDNARELFMVALVESLARTSSLSNRQRESYYVLQLILPELGWEKENISRLIQGDSLDDLLQLPGNPSLFQEFKPLRQYGGWLDHATIVGFRKHLKEKESAFLRPEEKLLSLLGGAAELLSVAPSTLVQRAYRDALDMLDSASLPEGALFLVLD